MISDIFTSILFGELSPWRKDFSDERLISDILKQAPSFTSGKVQSLHSRIKGILKEHSTLWKFPENNLKNGQDLSIEALFNLSVPNHFNAATRFYSELLPAESLRYINNLAAGVDACPVDIDIRYLVNSALNHLKYIAKNASKELNKRGLSGIPVYKPESNLSADEITNRNTHYAIYLLKLYSIKLIFEIQELYGIHVKATESFEEFFINTLNENVPEKSFLQCGSFYFANKVNRFLSSGADDFNSSFNMLEEMKKQFIDTGLFSSSAITAIENYIFIKQFNIFIDKFDFANLANSANSATFFTTVKKSITELINLKTYGNERFEIITEYLDKLVFLQELSIPANQQSATRKLHQWLTLQAEAYKGNLSSSFAIPAPDDDHAVKKSKPLPVLDKTTIDKLKSDAQEFLKHFSGHNVHQDKIMTKIDFNRLLEYTYYLIEHEQLPTEIKQIPQIHLPANHIRYTYYLMHKSFYGTKEIKPIWIEFLQKVFFQFAGQEWQTIKTKFSVIPSKYNQDLKVMLSS
jgi:hypothetical protein